jgi:hypothetical protein
MSVSKEGVFRHAALFFAMMASGGNIIVPREAWVVLTVVSCLALLRWRVPLLISRGFIYAWILLVILLLFVLQGSTNPLSIASRALTFLAALLLLEVYIRRPIDRLMGDLFNILKLMSVQAILTSIIGNLSEGLFSPVNVEGMDYQTLGFIFNFHYVHDVVGHYIRPDGFFYEPGIFQIYISIFLYICLFWRFSLFWAGIACLALVSLWSTVGVAVSAVLLVLSCRQLLFRHRGIKRAFLLAAYIFALPVITFLAISNYYEKVDGDLRGSFLAREYDFYTGVNIIKEKPMTGIGFGLDTYLQYNQHLGYDASDLRVDETVDRPNSNGLIQVLYTIGLPLGLTLLLGIVAQSLFPHRLPISVILGASFYSQSVVFTPFFLCILFSGFVGAASARRTLRTCSP